MKGIEASFFDRLQKAPRRLLLLDYDGTLAPFGEKRDRAFPYAGVVERLERLISSTLTRTVIITGRAINHIKPLLKLRKLPEIWGSHGWEHLSREGHYTLKAISPAFREQLEKARSFMVSQGWQEYLEEKPASMAVHFRGVDTDLALAIKIKILSHWRQMAVRYPLLISIFDGGLELRLPGINKGNVVREILKSESDEVVTAYLGDDNTDEDAFQALPSDALGILVRSEWRPTAASAWIQTPEELLDFFDRWLSAEENHD